MKRHLFLLVWLMIIVLLVTISLNYRSKESAMAAIVESQVTAISYQEPVVVERLFVIPGQEVKVGDTLLVVSRPDLALDIERKENELERVTTQIIQERQDFERRIALDDMERASRISQLNAERNELEAEIGRKEMIREQFSPGNTQAADTVRQIRLQAVVKEIVELQSFYRKEKEREGYLLEEKLALLDKEADLIGRELESLRTDATALVRTAKFQGTVGQVNVQLDELVSPFKTLLSVYEVRPSVIKAYLNEGFEAPVGPGDIVRVVSETRSYSINGRVSELGARITIMPSQFQLMQTPSLYGQEIFIHISKNNRFLNGERVLVYPVANSAEK